ncbi:MULTISPECIES: hypothetical protein [Lysobacteraceae]|nr:MULTISPECIES: hypothetical protein [Lysobacter]
METLRKLAMWSALVVGAGMAALGLWQVGRVTWALSNPPPLGSVFEPVIPLLIGVIASLAGFALVAAGRGLKR